MPVKTILCILLNSIESNAGAKPNYEGTLLQVYKTLLSLNIGYFGV